MGMKKPETIHVEVDMVPLIDIISLLLMFLVMVGDMTRSSTAVKMTLPRADQAKSDKEMTQLGVDTKGRIVVQLQQKEGKYWAVIENNRYELVAGGGNANLIKYLEEQIKKRQGAGMQVGPNGEVPFPVKLRIPVEAPMREVERVVMTLAQAKLVNVHYAADGFK